MHIDKLSVGASGIQGVTGSTGTTAYDLIVIDDLGTQHSLMRYVQPSYGYVLRVDKVYGNTQNAINYPFKYAFSTIKDAINAGQTLGTPLQIQIMPGIYDEQVTLQPNTFIRGVSTQAVIIQPTLTSGAAVVNVGANCRLEDVTVNATTTGSNHTLYGIQFFGTAPQNTKLRTIVVNVSEGAGLTGSSLYGIYVDGSGTNVTTQSSFNTIRASTVQVTGTTGTTLMRGIYNKGANRISFRDCNIYATQTGGTIGTTGAIGCETDASGAIIEARSSTISGTGNDINQGDNSTIILGMSDLVNRTANSRAFTLTTQTANQGYTLGNIDNGGLAYGKHYVAPGTIIYTGGSMNTLLSTPIPISFAQPTIVKSINVTPNTDAIPLGTTFTVERIAANGNPGITSMSVHYVGGTTSTAINTTQSMRVGTGDKINVSFTNNLNDNDLFYGDIILY